MKISKRFTPRGFTIVELAIVIAIFLFIIGAAISIFLSIVQRQKEVLSEQEILNQVSFVEEHMSKALRSAKVATGSTCIPEGYIYLLTDPDANNVYEGIQFINGNEPESNMCYKFYLDSNNILQEIKSTGTIDYGYTLALTAPSLKFNSDGVSPIIFSVNGGDGSVSGQGCNGTDPCGAKASSLGSAQNEPQPKVTILMNIKISADASGASRAIQTTTSRRNLNVAE